MPKISQQVSDARSYIYLGTSGAQLFSQPAAAAAAAVGVRATELGLYLCFVYLRTFARAAKIKYSFQYHCYSKREVFFCFFFFLLSSFFFSIPTFCMHFAMAKYGCKIVNRF